MSRSSMSPPTDRPPKAVPRHVVRHGLSALCGALRTDVSSSLVVFLVAVPLCVGVAVASGVPAELGLVTGIVGGLVTGLLPGSSLHVSGPAAGLTVLVLEAVREYGVATLGVVVPATGALQLAMGAMRWGRWFRATSVAVVEGMLAGIGLVLMTGQVYALVDARAPGAAPANLAGLGGLVTRVAGAPTALTALAVGLGTLAVLAVWPRWRRAAGVVPAPLVAVGGATLVVAALDLPVARVEVRGLLTAVHPPGVAEFDCLTEVGVWGTVLAFTLIASAASLFTAAAVDRLHDGERTHYDRELMAQGVGNAVCGLLGALPMTAVIVRSAANVRAGARTRLSRVLHGGWLLLFAAAFPAVLGVVPVAALAAVLLHASTKLLPVREVRRLWREHRGEAVVLLVTTVAIVALSMFEGVLVGLAAAIVKSAWETSHVRLEVREVDGVVRVRAWGNATFLRLPKLLDQLAALPADRPVELDLSGLRHLDHACGLALASWAESRRPAAATVTGEPARTGAAPIG